MTEHRLIDYPFHKSTKKGLSVCFYDDQEHAIPVWGWLLVIILISLIIVVR